MPILQITAVGGWDAYYEYDPGRKLLNLGEGVLLLEDGDEISLSSISSRQAINETKWSATRIKSGIGDQIVMVPVSSEATVEGHLILGPNPTDYPERERRPVPYLGEPFPLPGAPSAWVLRDLSAMKWGTSIGLSWNGRFHLWRNEVDFFWRWMYLRMLSGDIPLDDAREQAFMFEQEPLLEFLSTQPEAVDFYLKPPNNLATENSPATEHVRFTTLEVGEKGGPVKEALNNILTAS